MLKNALNRGLKGNSPFFLEKDYILMIIIMDSFEKL